MKRFRFHLIFFSTGGSDLTAKEKQFVFELNRFSAMVSEFGTKASEFILDLKRFSSHPNKFTSDLNTDRFWHSTMSKTDESWQDVTKNVT